MLGEIVDKPKKIFVVEDTPEIQELLTHTLKVAGYQVGCCDHGDLAMQKAVEMSPDILIIDWMLPGKNGLEIIKDLRATEQFSSNPILMLTAKNEDEDIIAGLDAGADDYITKPFRPKVLLARIKRAERQYKPDSVSNLIELHNLTVDPQRHLAFVDKQELTLTISEFKAIQHLISKPGWVFTREQIMEAVHGEGYIVSERSIDVMIVGLRKKMSSAGKLIETVRGIGYRMTE